MTENIPESEKSLLPNPFDMSIDPVVFNSELVDEDISAHVSEIKQSRKPNFPFFFPVVYHNISHDIPKRYSYAVKFCLISFFSFFFSILLMFIAQIFSNKINSSLIYRWREIILSFFILIICPVSLIYGQYFPIYNAAREGTKNKALIIFQFFTIFVFFFFVIGIPGSGIIGIGYAIVAIRFGETINKALSLIITLWDILNLVLQVKVLLLISPIATHTDSPFFNFTS